MAMLRGVSGPEVSCRVEARGGGLEGTAKGPFRHSSKSPGGVAVTPNWSVSSCLNQRAPQTRAAIRPARTANGGMRSASCIIRGEKLLCRWEFQSG